MLYVFNNTIFNNYSFFFVIEFFNLPNNRINLSVISPESTSNNNNSSNNNNNNEGANVNNSENSARIKLRFIINEKQPTSSEDMPNEEAYSQKGLHQSSSSVAAAAAAAAASVNSMSEDAQNTTLQPCVNFPFMTAEEKAKKYDFTPILNREELE